MIALLLLLVSTTTLLVSGVRFECMPSCTCDTVDEAIHCHNLGLTALPVPSDSPRLRGYTVLGLTGNAIQRLPSEDDILKVYPDLLAIDVEGNQFDCESLRGFRKLTVLSDCMDAAGNASRANRMPVPPVGESTADCDLECKMQKYYRKLHEYVGRLWGQIKDRYQSIDKDQIIADIKNFVRNLVKKIVD